MLVFEPNANAVVHFEITGRDERRHKISLPLVAYLTLVKSSRTLEELCTLLFQWRSTEEKTKAASA